MFYIVSKVSLNLFKAFSIVKLVRKLLIPKKEFNLKGLIVIVFLPFKLKD